MVVQKHILKLIHIYTHTHIHSCSQIAEFSDSLLSC
jgi:hypothetical protein